MKDLTNTYWTFESSVTLAPPARFGTGNIFLEVISFNKQTEKYNVKIYFFVNGICVDAIYTENDITSTLIEITDQNVVQKIQFEISKRNLNKIQ
jgi:hypothetical protein